MTHIITDYIVITAATAIELSRQVNVALSTGWKPLGGVACSVVPGIATWSGVIPNLEPFCQAMVKYERSSGDISLRKYKRTRNHG